MAETTQRWWTVQHGPGPVLATAIHHGHELRPEVAEALALSDFDRLREEDPYTGDAASAAATHIIVHRSRFEFDLNRPPEGAVYQTPDQCWGLEVWKSGQPEPRIVERSLALHAGYFRMLGALLDSVAERHGRFVLFDVHSYNHRRDGPEAPESPQELAPDINIGTFSMPRDDWAFLLDPLMEAMRGFDFNGRKLDVRENVAFQGKGYQTRFVHERYPLAGCAIALEIKKFYMDEWTGVPDRGEVQAMQRFIGFIAQKAEELLQ